MSDCKIEVRQTSHPREVETMDTAALRENFLVEALFTADRVRAVYSHYDRMVILGAMPVSGTPSLGSDLAHLVREAHFLARREVAFFNVGGPGRIVADGITYQLGKLDALYLGRGTRDVRFESADAGAPAQFYGCSAGAHTAYPAKLLRASEITGDALGSQEAANKRLLTKYIHPGAFPTCQLVMGVTRMDSGSVWNTMPPHLHDRRMEAYLYFDLPADAAVMHFMGRPEATRHVVIRDRQAVISPPWSIHSGCGTSAYAFIWAMAGDNQAFTDMDAVPIPTLA
jgi:4-deoxy-L-threo-5-hexosulose-uronate ketol-isomerase